MDLMNAMTLMSNVESWTSCAMSYKGLPVPFALTIASRPEHHIAFDLGDSKKCRSRLPLDNAAKNPPISEDFGCCRGSLQYGGNYFSVTIQISIGMAMMGQRSNFR